MSRSKSEWKSYRKKIREGSVAYDEFVDQINFPIHHFAYNRQNKLIEAIPQPVINNILLQENSEGDTVGHIAGKTGNTDLLRYVIDTKPELLYSENAVGNTPLFYVAEDKPLVKEILRSHEISDHYINNDFTLIDYYLLSHDRPMLKESITHTSHTNHPLFTLLSLDEEYDESERYQIYQMIANSLPNKSLNTYNPYSYTSPLIMATYLNDIQIMTDLLARGADPNYGGAEGLEYPLFIALNNNNSKIVKLLLKYGADPNIINKYMQTPIHYIYEEGKAVSTGTKELLLYKITDFNAVDNKLNSILFLLVKNNDWQRFKSILSQKCLSIYLSNKDGQSPIDLIAQTDMTAFIQIVHNSYMNELKRIPKEKLSDDFDLKMQKKILRHTFSDDDSVALLERIQSGKISCPRTELKYAINILNAPSVNITNFSAYTYSYLSYLYYLLDKYPQIQIPHKAQKQFDRMSIDDIYDKLSGPFRQGHYADKTIRSLLRDYINHSPYLVNHVIIWNSPDKYFISPYIFQGIVEAYKRHPDAKYVLIKLTLIPDKNLNHANILIYDIDNRTIERFDPYGAVPYVNIRGLDQSLKELFKEFFPHVTYVPPSDVMNMMSFQAYSDEVDSLNVNDHDPIGFCVAWCIWYVEMRVSNPTIPSPILISHTIPKINMMVDKFKDYIRNYSAYLDKMKNKVLETNGLPPQYFYSKNPPTKYYVPYLKNMRTSFSKMTEYGKREDESESERSD